MDSHERDMIDAGVATVDFGGGDRDQPALEKPPDTVKLLTRQLGCANYCGPETLSGTRCRDGRTDRLDELAYSAVGKMTGYISLADQSHQTMLLDHRDPADLMFFHHRKHVLDLGRGINVVDGALGEFADGHHRRVVVDCNALEDNVAVSDDAVQTIIVAADRQCADIEFPHALRGCGDGVVLTNTSCTGVPEAGFRRQRCVGQLTCSGRLAVSIQHR